MCCGLDNDLSFSLFIKTVAFSLTLLTLVLYQHIPDPHNIAMPQAVSQDKLYKDKIHNRFYVSYDCALKVRWQLVPRAYNEL